MIKINMPEFDKVFKYSDLHKFKSYFSYFPGCVYVFKDEVGEVLYVGKSKRTYNRLISHKSSIFSGDIKTVSVKALDDPTERDIIETYSIKLFNPIHNKDKLHVNVNGKAIRARMNKIYDSLSYEEERIYDLESCKEDIEYSLMPPSKRRYSNNFKDDGELAEGFYEYLEELSEFNSNSFEEELEELRLIDEELSVHYENVIYLKDELADLERQLSV